MSNLISLCTVCHKTEEHKLKHQQIVFPFASIARDERHIALGRIFVTKTLYTKKPVSEESRAKRSASMLAMTRKHEIMLEWEGESKSLAQWARQYNLARDLVYKRIKEGGWPIGKALTHPHRKQLARKAAQ